jgi:serine phosphatase RsbU (regulator of sigma subunit)
VPGDPSCLVLDDRPDGVRMARRFVEEQVLARGGSAFVDDAALVAAELLANAIQHGAPPVVVCVSGGSGRVRIEVRDGSPRIPVRPARSLSNMTGRGVALIEAMAGGWGVERGPGPGKTVWAELAESPPDTSAAAPTESLLADWGDDREGGAEERFTIVLGDVPTDLLIESKAHMDNLVRELSLAGAGADAELPPHYARLIETVLNTWGDARDAIKRQALAAAGRGDQRTRLTLRLPASAADAGEAYLAALDEADSYSRAARLLTLETPPDHRVFRRWYVEAVVDQVRDLAAGRSPHPVQPFDSRLVAEVRRLSSAQRAGDRAARLQRVTAALARTRTPEDVAAVVVSEGVDALGASGGGLLLPAPDGLHIAVPGVVGYEGGLVDALREELLDAPLPAATALRTGEPVWLESREDRDREFPALHGFEAATISMCAVPLEVTGRVLGALRFSFDVRKLFDEDERGFVLALAALTAQTLERTELYQSERNAALNLQRALLPQHVSVPAGWDVASFYRPAGDQEVGGDFYDVVPLQDGRFAAVVGDVMGRGLEAAAAMAQVRSTVRAYAVEDPDAATVFRRVDAFFAALDVPQLVTALYLLADPTTGTVEVVNAGHLPPLLVERTGSRVVPTEVGPPFGVGRPQRRSVTVSLDRGAALVAITDGLVERRGEDIDAGVARVLAASSAGRPADAEALLSDIVSAALAHRTHDDDVTVLVLRRK